MPRICGPACDDDPGPVGQRRLAHLLGFNAHGVTIDLVGERPVVLSREVQTHAVGQVTTVSEGKTENGIANVGHGHERRSVGLSAGVRLNVDVVTTKDLLSTLNCQGFGHVDELASAVVAPPRVPFCVFVRQDRALRLENGSRNKVLRGDHLQGVALSPELGI